VPSHEYRSRADSSWARTMPPLASGGEPREHRKPPPEKAASRALMDALFAHAEVIGDLLPGPRRARASSAAVSVGSCGRP
jgi:hypothetical protein